MKKFLKVAPFKVKRVQKGNGSELAGSFEKFLRSKGIIHFYNYPKDPQSNAYVERFNRTIQEHFVGGTSENLIEPEKFNINLINYLLFYNTKKPHKSLNNFSPLDYFLKTYINNPYQSKMLWYSTFI